MKRFSKMFALGMAMAMTFGMVVSAAGSVTVDDSNITGEAAVLGVTSTVTNKEDGSVVSVTVEAVDNDENVASFDAAKQNVSTYIEGAETAVYDKYLAEAPAAPEGKKVEAVKTELVKLFDLAVDGGGEVTDKVTVEFSGDWIVNDTVYIVIHFGKTTESYAVKALDGKISVELNGLSPIAILAAEPVLVGDTTEDDRNPGGGTTPSTTNPTNTNTGSTSQPEAPKSPRTGEALPMAAIMALICLAGAAVCARKVRYSQQ